MDAMILVAHPDDETLGAGGMIQKLVKRGWRVKVVMLSNGIVDVRGRILDNRSDAKAACALLGIEEPRFLGFPDQKFDRVSIAELVTVTLGAVSSLGLKPDLIVTHVDADLNLDHRLTCEVAKIVGRPTHKPVSILGCEVPNTSFWNARPFPANYYIDITEEIERKIQAFEKYHNELQQFPHPWSRKGLELLAEYHGMQSGFQRAEAFTMIRGYEGRL
jgi:LmbE family N-acetylglucosaminyl deacetylase